MKKQKADEAAAGGDAADSCRSGGRTIRRRHVDQRQPEQRGNFAVLPFAGIR